MVRPVRGLAGADLDEPLGALQETRQAIPGPALHPGRSAPDRPGTRAGPGLLPGSAEACHERGRAHEPGDVMSRPELDPGPPPTEPEWIQQSWTVRLRRGLWRHRATIAACAPAALAAVVVATIAVAAARSEPRSLVEGYLNEADQSLRSKNLKQAIVCLERACRLEPAEPSHRFALSQALAWDGVTGRAQVLLEELAPLDQPGYAPAQVWRAAGLLRQEAITRSRIQDAETHLLHALQSDPNQQDAHLLLGELYARTGRPEQAAPHLARFVRQRPELSMLLSAGYQSLGKAESARDWAKVAAAEFRTRVEGNPADETSRLRWAAVTVWLKDYAGAVRI